MPFKLGKRPALDGVRGVFMLWVMAFHFRDAEHALPTRGGFLSVDVFFVLSGFLITVLLLEEHDVTGTFSFGAFYARRALRLLPALFAVVGVWTLWVTLFDHSVAHRAYGEAIAALAYGENWYHGLSSFHSGVPTGLSHTWSLSIEEQFYIVWPCLLWVVLRRGAKFATVVTALALFAVPIIRLAEWHGDGSVNRLYFSTQTRADTLLAGCLLGLLLHYGYIREWATRALRLLLPLAFVFVVLSCIFAYHRSPVVYKGGYTLFSLAVAVVLWGILERRFLCRVLEWRPLLWTGRRSYGLYLWHWPIFNAALDHWGHAKIAGPVSVPLTFLAAWASYRWIELPFLRLKRRFKRVKPALPGVDEVAVTEPVPEPVLKPA